MAEKKTFLTYEGLKEREEELVTLKTVRRKDVAEKIKEARGQGDLSENAEYDAAKEEQAEIEAKIVMLETMLRNAEVIDEDKYNKDEVTIGCKVVLYDEEFQENVTFTIVGSAEANPVEGRISNESPLGSSILGHKIDDVVSVEAPQGIVVYKILEIK